MERNRQAQELFQQALADGADPKRQDDLYRRAIALVHDLGKAHNNVMGKPFLTRRAVA